MQFKSIVQVFPFIWATACAQDIAQVLSSHENLSRLESLISNDRELADTLNSEEDVTFLAPSNEALGGSLEDGNFSVAMLQYHLLNGRFSADNITESGMFIPTMLTDESLVTISGGQVVQVMKTDDSSDDDDAESSEEQIKFFSGYHSNSTVVESDISFDGGLLHIIDNPLVIPENVTTTSVAAGLSSLAGAVNDTDFQWDEWQNATFFAPNNEAFKAVGSALANMTTEELHTVLMYHVINDTLPIYTGRIGHADWITTTGENITFSVGEDDTIFVNSAAIIEPNVLVANGVIHVIDNVLNPNATSTEPPDGDSGTPAFEDAQSTDQPPFTSGAPTATTTMGDAPTQIPTHPAGPGGSGPDDGSDDGPEDGATAIRSDVLAPVVALIAAAVAMVNI